VPPGPYTTAQLAADAAAVLDAAGLERASVVGASLGGMAAQELALARPERIERLVLVCTTAGGEGSHPLPKATQELLEEVSSLPPDVALRRLVENALAAGAPSELVDRIVEYRTANPPDLAGWQALAAAGLGHDALGRLGRISTPTLVVHGTGDRVIDHRNARLLASRLPDAELELLPGRGHLLFWEDPEGFARLVREFVG
jgi:pimeloyl-ACP methyl ester carboxylesterase